MSDLVFTYKVKAQPNGTVSFRTIDVQFGDGYMSSMGDGPNNRVQTWQIGMVGDTNADARCDTGSEYLAAKAFLDARQGFQSFLWTPPGEAQGHFKCSGYSPTSLGGGIFQFTATFTQVFFP